MRTSKHAIAVEEVEDDNEGMKGAFWLDCLMAGGIAMAILVPVSGLYAAAFYKFGLKPENVSLSSFIYNHMGIVISLAAVLVGFLAFYVATKVNESVHLSTFRSRYGEDSMYQALNTIGNVGKRWAKLKEEGKCDFYPIFEPRSEDNNPRGKGKGRLKIENVEQLITEAERRLPWDEAENKARRIVKNYFSSALQLYRNHSISKSALKNICDNDSLTLLFKVIEPMECLLNSRYHYKVFYDIMDVMKKEYPRIVKQAEQHDKRKRLYLNVDKLEWPEEVSSSKVGAASSSPSDSALRVSVTHKTLTAWI